MPISDETFRAWANSAFDDDEGHEECHQTVGLLVAENRRLLDDNTRLRSALLEVERHCPCGARPESLNTHPHVTRCPVGDALYFDGSSDA